MVTDTNGTYPVECPTGVFKYQSSLLTMLVILCTHILKAHRGSSKECLPRGGSNNCSKRFQQEAIMRLSKKVIYPEEEEDGSGRYKRKTVMSGRNKSVKIRGYNSTKKYGIAAKDVKELLDKGCKSLKVRPASKSFRRPFNRAGVEIVS